MEQLLSEKPPLARKGNLLVVQKGAVMPPLCVKCGQPAGEPTRERYTWHTPWLYLLIIIGLLFYAIGYLLMRKKFELDVPVCQTHHDDQRRRRRNALWVFWGSIGAAFLSGFVPADYIGWWILALFVSILGSAIYFSVVSRLLTPHYIDDHEAHLRGAAEPFLFQLPAVS